MGVLEAKLEAKHLGEDIYGRLPCFKGCNELLVESPPALKFGSRTYIRALYGKIDAT